MTVQEWCEFIDSWEPGEESVTDILMLNKLLKCADALANADEHYHTSYTHCLKEYNLAKAEAGLE